MILKKFIQSAALALSLSFGVMSCKGCCLKPDQTVISTAPQEGELSGIIGRLYNYLDLQNAGAEIGKEIDTKSYIKDLGDIVSYLLKKEFDIEINIKTGYYDSKQRYCKALGEHIEVNSILINPGCSPIGVTDPCNQTVINPYGLNPRENFQSIAHETGHYIENEFFGGGRGEKIARFFQKVLYLLGYTSFPPETREDGLKYLFSLEKPAENDLLFNLQHLIREGPERALDWHSGLLVDSYGFWQALYETEGDFKKSLVWLLNTSDENIRHLHRQSVEERTFCSNLETAVLSLQNQILSRTRGGYSYQGTNETENYFNYFHREIQTCHTKE